MGQTALLFSRNDHKYNYNFVLLQWQFFSIIYIFITHTGQILLYKYLLKRRHNIMTFLK